MTVDFTFHCSDTFMTHDLCRSFAVQNTSMSTVDVDIDEVSDGTEPAPNHHQK